MTAMMMSRCLKAIALLGLMLALGACASAPTSASMASTQVEARLEGSADARMAIALESEQTVLQTLEAAPNQPVTLGGLTPGRRYRVLASALAPTGERLGEAEATVVAGAVQSVVLTVHLTTGLAITSGTIVDPTAPEAFE
ncbi:MAG: hypothetical protein ACLGIN_07760 [Candidatus Sericytochromatia bacterium]